MEKYNLNLNYERILNLMNKLKRVNHNNYFCYYYDYSNNEAYCKIFNNEESFNKRICLKYPIVEIASGLCKDRCDSLEFAELVRDYYNSNININNSKV